MPRLEETRTVPRPRSEVYAYTADFANIEEWDPGVISSESVDSGPIQVGSEFDLIVKFGSRELPMRYTIAELEPDARVVLEGVGDKLIAIDEIRFADVDDGGTRIDYTADLEFEGFLRFVVPLIGGTLNKAGRDALDGLASRLR